MDGGRGDWAFSTSASDGTYPDDGIHSDGYWYLKGYLSNYAPVVVIKSSGDKTLYNDGDEFRITGTVQDDDNDIVRISASVGGVDKSAEISDTQSTKHWTLTWSGKELPAGVHSSPMVWVTDGPNGEELYYQGKITVVKQKYYYWNKYRVERPLPYFWSGSGETNGYPNVPLFYTGFNVNEADFIRFRDNIQ